jgi:hypothetical protein
MIAKYVIYNTGDKPAGPFDLFSIFGPLERSQTTVTVDPGKSAALYGPLPTPYEHVTYSFNNRRQELGLEEGFVFVVPAQVDYDSDVDTANVTIAVIEGLTA